GDARCRSGRDLAATPDGIVLPNRRLDAQQSRLTLNPMTLIEIILLLLSIAIIALQIVALARKNGGRNEAAEAAFTAQIAQLNAQLKTDLQRHQQDLSERTERELRGQIQ